MVFNFYTRNVIWGDPIGSQLICPGLEISVKRQPSLRTTLSTD